MKHDEEIIRTTVYIKIKNILIIMYNIKNKKKKSNIKYIISLYIMNMGVTLKRGGFSLKSLI